MTHPGSSPFAAFQKVFREAARVAPDPNRAVADAIGKLQRLRAAGAGFFVAHPGASATLDHLAREDPAYVAHEYLNPFFQPLHAADLIADMKVVGLAYIGSATPVENIDSAQKCDHAFIYEWKHVSSPA